MKSITLLVMVLGLFVSAGAYAQAGEALVKSKNCLTCHEADKKKVGPSFKETAAKYKGNKEAEAKLIGGLKEGKGHPVKVAATDAELKTLVEYVLSRK